MKKFCLCLLITLSSFMHASANMDLLISQEEISEKVREIAAQIDRDYEGEEITLIMVMKGAVCLVADLMREIQTPFTIEAMSASSYGQNGMKSGQLTIKGLETADLTGKNILVVDDIFDTGKTMFTIVESLKERGAKSVRSLALLVKKVPRLMTYRPDYILFEIENRFVIGYGLDYKEFYRGLPAIYAFVGDVPPDAE